MTQLRKWVIFCDEESRAQLLASEEHLLSYIGFLSQEGLVGPRTAPQYVTTVSRYCKEFLGF